MKNNAFIRTMRSCTFIFIDYEKSFCNFFLQDKGPSSSKTFEGDHKSPAIHSNFPFMMRSGSHCYITKGEVCFYIS